MSFILNIVFTLSVNCHPVYELQPCSKSDTLRIIIVFDWSRKKVHSGCGNIHFFAPLFFTLAPPRRAPRFLVRASDAVALKVAQVPSTGREWRECSECHECSECSECHGFHYCECSEWHAYCDFCECLFEYCILRVHRALITVAILFADEFLRV